MAKRDYYPRSGTYRATFLSSLVAGLPDAAQAVGLPQAEVQELASAVAEVEELRQARLSKRKEAIAATSAYRAQDQALEQKVRALVQRLKSQPGYTTAMGTDLGLEAPPDQRTLVRQDAVAQGAKPRLRLVSAESGRTLVAFTKDGFDGIELYCGLGGSAKDYELVGRYTRSPALDPRPNRASAPETRRYQACYLRADQPVGQMSQILHATVGEWIAVQTPKEG